MQRLLRNMIAATLAAGLAAMAVQVPAQAETQSQAQSSLDHSDRFKRVAYFIQWGVYGRNYHVKDMDTSGAAAKLTHVNYAFGFVNSDGDCYSADPWADWQRPVPAEQSVDGVADAAGQALNGNLNQLKKLKAKHPGLKTLISLGGWTGSKYFSDAVLTPEGRARLASSCVDLWLKGNLPGSAPGAARVSSTASTSTGSGPVPPARSATSSVPRTSGTSPCSSPSCAAR
ncbi:glycoside hydrolase family 18 protein [Streptosporangium lutulentum]